MLSLCFIGFTLNVLNFKIRLCQCNETSSNKTMRLILGFGYNSTFNRQILMKIQPSTYKFLSFIWRFINKVIHYMYYVSISLPSHLVMKHFTSYKYFDFQRSSFDRLKCIYYVLAWFQDSKLQCHLPFISIQQTSIQSDKWIRSIISKNSLLIQLHAIIAELLIVLQNRWITVQSI